MAKEKRLMRLTWNTTNWNQPIKRNYFPEKQGTQEAFEKVYGFGHEEWLLNQRYLVDGFQHGYIRGIESLKLELDVVDEIYLYTIDTETKDRKLVAVLYDVELIDIPQEQKKVAALFKKYRKYTEEEVKAVGADYKNIKKYPFKPNVKFNYDKSTFFHPPIIINELKQGDNKYKYNRFIPYIINDELEEILEEGKKLSKFKFKVGKRKKSKNNKRATKASSIVVSDTHNKITDKLYKYLALSYSKEQLSLESTEVAGGIVDFVVKIAENTYNVYEVKTQNSAKENIREAIGQLLEYSFIDNSIIAKELVIIGPAKPTKEELQYIKTLQNKLKLAFQYWHYDINESEIEKKFNKY